jgi:hypothetical protein
MLERGLNNIVGEIVSQQLFHFRASNNKFLNQATLDVHIGDTNALLHDIRAELLLGQFNDAPSETRAQWASKVWNVEIKNVLYNIVAKWILNERVCVLNDMGDELGLLCTSGMINAALQDTASVAVSTNDETVVSDSFEDEFGIDRLKVVEALLDDMVAIEVLDESDNILFKSTLDCLNL